MDPAGHRTDYASGYVWHVYGDVEEVKTEWVKEEIPGTYNFWVKTEKRIETSVEVPIRLYLSKKFTMAYGKERWI